MPINQDELDEVNELSHAQREYIEGCAEIFECYPDTIAWGLRSPHFAEREGAKLAQVRMVSRHSSGAR